MEQRPVTRYAKAPDGVSMAYQVTGEGPLDLVMLPAFSFPIDLLWDEPAFVRFAARLGRFSRPIWTEFRGVGASGGDIFDDFDEETADTSVTAILDAAGCEQAVVVGVTASGPTAVRYAAWHPERVSALVLVNTFAHNVREDDYPWGVPLELLRRFAAAQGEMWGSGSALDVVAPSRQDDVELRGWFARSQRLAVGADVAGGSWLESRSKQDVRPLLSSVSAPTLVLHRQGDRFIRAGNGRYLAEHIPGATYVELTGEDNLFFVGDVDGLLDEVEEFLTGRHLGPEGDVVTTTILFTDIVASTEYAARLGHRRWTALTDRHDAMVRSTLARGNGREIKTTGDGFLATFTAASRAVRAATEIVRGAERMGLSVRAGVHTGEVEVRADDVVGLAVSIAKRVCDQAGANEVFVSEAVRLHLVGTGLETADRGRRSLKGVPEDWQLYAVVGGL